jgi:hypothetical protein
MAGARAGVDRCAGARTSDVGCDEVACAIRAAVAGGAGTGAFTAAGSALTGSGSAPGAPAASAMGRTSIAGAGGALLAVVAPSTRSARLAGDMAGAFVGVVGAVAVWRGAGRGSVVGEVLSARAGSGSVPAVRSAEGRAAFDGVRGVPFAVDIVGSTMALRASAVPAGVPGIAVGGGGTVTSGAAWMAGANGEGNGAAVSPSGWSDGGLGAKATMIGTVVAADGRTCGNESDGP